MSGNFWTTLPVILTGITGVLGGIVGVYQAVTNIPSTHPTQTVQSTITVDAKSEQGTPYPNPENHPVKVNFKADGRWVTIPESIPGDLPKGPLSAKGAGGFSANANRRCPGFALGALIVSTDQEKCLASGEQGTFDLQSNQTAYFLMNDVIGNYGDNGGSIQVSLSLAK